MSGKLFENQLKLLVSALILLLAILTCFKCRPCRLRIVLARDQSLTCVVYLLVSFSLLLLRADFDILQAKDQTERDYDCQASEDPVHRVSTYCLLDRD